MASFGFPIVGVALFAFLTISAVAGMISGYKTRRLEIEAVRSAIEHGQPIDPALIDRLVGKNWRPEERSSPQPLGLRIGAIVTMASGVGIALFSFFLFLVAPVAFYPIFGIGVLVVCIGLGLLICASVVERDRKARSMDKAGP